MEILNIDKFIPDNKEVVIEGKTYYLPGEVPTDLTLKITKLQQSMTKVANGEIEESGTAMREFVDLICEIFVSNNEGFDENIIRKKLGFQTLSKIVEYLYNTEVQEALGESNPETETSTM